MNTYARKIPTMVKIVKDLGQQKFNARPATKERPAKDAVVIQTLSVELLDGTRMNCKFNAEKLPKDFKVGQDLVVKLPETVFTTVYAEV